VKFYPQETLDWDDEIGWCVRTLDSATKCPSCSSLYVRRLDTRRLCTHATHVPVRCARCHYWFALPKVLLVGKPSAAERLLAWLRRVWA
jgi:hypothetical protein